MHSQKRKLFLSPWGFREGLCLGGSLLLSGFILEAAAGAPAMPGHPMNIFLAIMLAGMVIYLHKTSSDHPFIKWLSGVPGSVSAFATFASLAALIAFIPQTGGANGVMHLLAIDRVTQSWPYALSIMWLLISLGLVILRNLRTTRRGIFFLLHHVGLWLVLFGGGLGAGDTQRLAVQTVKGETVAEAMTMDGTVKPLPFALSLLQFDIDYFPPKLVMVDAQTGRMSDKKKALPFAQPGKSAHLHGWEITTRELLPAALPREAAFVEIDMPGSGSAVYVTAFHKQKGLKREGWLFSGTPNINPQGLSLDESTLLYIFKPDPKEFRSELIVHTRNGAEKQIFLTVNHPVKIEGWDIYQTGYDTTMGKFSKISVLTMVYDPWIKIVYLGIAMMLAGAFALVIFGTGRKQVTS